MVKPTWHSEERYNTPRECIEAQIKKYGIRKCMYHFLSDGSCCSQLLDAVNIGEATAEEMIEIAVDHFNKYGEVSFEGFGDEGYITGLGCWDENAFGTKYIEKYEKFDNNEKNEMG